MDVFAECKVITRLLEERDESGARNRVIELLDYLRGKETDHSELLNHLVRSVGLFPYVDSSSASWVDRVAVEAFKSDVGLQEAVPLHIEQSRLLGKLLDGGSVAVSAPTSFGKSFVIDAFIAIKEPQSVLIIVPTIALMDETRRRLHRKFGRRYRVITAAGEVSRDGGPYIMICPQERAIALAQEVDQLDLLVVDEFYKASVEFDRDRSAALVRAILRFSGLAKQRYFLAPNVSKLSGGPLTEGMEFLRLDFNTVVLRVSSRFEEIAGDEKRKASALKAILESVPGKSLIYAGTYSQVEVVANHLRVWCRASDEAVLKSFSAWLRANYGPSWKLPDLVTRGVGIHNGQLHRPLSQIQIRLFEEASGLKTLVSTSSIIEGVNTSAENVVLWSAKNGSGRISDFDFRNIAGRGGRMFRHFVGNVYVLEQPPPEVEAQLSLELPDCLLGFSDVEKAEVTDRQRECRDSFRGDLAKTMSGQDVEELLDGGRLQSSDTALVRLIAQRIAANPSEFRALRFLNSDDPERWAIPLYRIIGLDAAGWDAPHRTVVATVQALACNWSLTIPEMLGRLEDVEMSVEKFFKLERLVSYRLASLINDINVIHAKVVPDRGFDISPFAARLSNAFLPPVVSSLEEYGLPRMISRLLQNIGVMNFEAEELTVVDAIRSLLDFEDGIMALGNFGDFERYLLDYFFDGIRGEEEAWVSQSQLS